MESIDDSTSFSAWTIRVHGTVQGVGFRPHVLKLAREKTINGFVCNSGRGVLIEAWCKKNTLHQFVSDIQFRAPTLAKIEKIEIANIYDAFQFGVKIPTNFEITATRSETLTTNIPPDAAACAGCLADCFDTKSRRFRYPFTNCTNCGPRLSIIRSMPYDRSATSMSEFRMCEICQREYDNPEDRRFHAQPNACTTCGPRVWLECADGSVVDWKTLSQLDAVDAATTLIKRGEIVAVKGIGGFHLACDATNETAVDRMRAKKKRYGKPFALMARDLSMVEQYCNINEDEAEYLRSHVAPIVIVQKKATNFQLARSVAPAQTTIGFMLPYTPLHHLIMEKLNVPIVLTSGNLSNEPQCITNEQAKSQLGQIADYLLLNDREIVNRLDDSVVRLSGTGPIYIRRARGIAPNPIPLPPGFEKAPDLIAMGGELKNTFCLLKDSRAIISQHIGDLEDAQTFLDYQHNLGLYSNSFKHSQSKLVVDLHPDYLSSKLGRNRARAGALDLEEVQHHHAHIASCMADNNLPLDSRPVIGVALDGLGFGSDGTLWGGEFLICDYTTFERRGTFKPVALLGGKQAMYEPWRNTYAHLAAGIGWDAYQKHFSHLELSRFFATKPIDTFASMLKAGINVPLASSCGRLFDAVSAAIGVCRDYAVYEGQAAIELEAIVDMNALLDDNDACSYSFAVAEPADAAIPFIEPYIAWQEILTDLARRTNPGIMAARFHKGLANAIVQMVQRLCMNQEETWYRTVVLSGGVFQNKILQELVVNKLAASGFEVLTHQRVPANDGGLSLGQAVIAAAKHIKYGEEQNHVSRHSWSDSRNN